MRKLLNLKLNNKSGFTLAELLTVIAISAILLGIGMLAIVSYAKDLHLKEMDNAAKEIFISAQNHLTAAKTSGKLESYVTKHEDSSTDATGIGTLMEYTPNDLPDGLTWPADEKNDVYYYIVHSPASDAPSINASFLNQMLPNGSIDDDIRTGGSYIVEYNIETAQVYGVFYTTDFILSNSDVIKITDDEGRLSDKHKEVCREYENGDKKGAVGYYGGAMARKMIDEASDNLTLEIKNEDILQAVITDKNYFKKGSNNHQLKTEVTLIVDGQESGATMEIKLPLTASLTPDNGIAVKNATSKTKSGVSTTSSMSFWDVKQVTVDKEQALEYTVDLDNITVSKGHFADIFKDFIPGENLSISVKSEASDKTDAPGAVLTVITENQTTNSLFDTVEPTENKVTYGNAYKETAYVSCSRHIENLDSAISNIPTSSTLQGNKYLVTDVVQTKDIDWEDFKAKVNGDKPDDDKIINGYNDASLKGSTSAGTFYAIGRTDLYSYDGQEYSIKNIVVKNQNASTNTAGIQDGGIFRFVSLKNHSVELKNITIENADITATKNAGGLYGETIDSTNSMTVENVLVYNSTITCNADNASAGGIGGYTKGKNITFTDCAAVAKCTNNSSKEHARAGGLVGRVDGNSSSSRITVTNCYAGGMTKDGVYAHADGKDYNIYAPGGYAGGFISCLGGDGIFTFTNCYTTASVYGEKSSGGFLAYRMPGNTRVTLTNCYTTGYVYYNPNSKLSGTIIGADDTAAGSMTFNNVYYLSSINSTLAAVGACNVNDGTSAVAKTYDEMKTSSQTGIEEHPIDGTLKNVKYPFTTVNTTGMTGKSAVGVHYGDWPAEQTEVASEDLDLTDVSAALVYYEVVDGKTYYSILGTKNDGSAYYTDNLITRSDKYVTSYNYAFLLPGSKTSLQGNINSTFKQGQYFDQYFIANDNSVPFTIYPLDAKKTGVITVSYGKYTYNINSDFANTMSSTATGAKSLPNGSATNAYEVRTLAQLQNITNNKYYKQTCDINAAGLTPTDTAVIDKNLNSVYDGGGYTIVINQKISNADSSGIFKKISDKSGNFEPEVKNLNVSGSIVSENGSKDIGGIASTSTGKMTNCSANGLTITCTGSSDRNVGLLVGRLQSGFSMTGCSGEGTIDLTGISNSTSSFDVGGIAGQATGGTITETYGKATINADKGNSNMNIGGFIGEINSDAEIYDSYAITTFGENTEGSLFAAAVSNENVSIARCHAALYGEDGLIVGDSLIFMPDGITDTENCYGLSTNIIGANSITTVEAYKLLETFTGFDDDTWEIVNDLYPTLKGNKE